MGQFRIALIAFLLSGCKLATSTSLSGSSQMLRGRVVSLEGKPVSAALVTTMTGQAKTSPDGWFQIPAKQDAKWVTVRHPGFISRTRAAAPDTPVLVRLTPDDGKTIAIHFTGDMMFGRRFYDPNEDGDTSDGLLQPNAGVDAHKALLRYVQPLLENADLTVSNLESPLIPEPYYDPTRHRPSRFHPTKDYAFASAPVAALALRQVGVDIVGLGNNHMYDGLDHGVTNTLKGLSQAGFKLGTGYFGAGLYEQEAWTPAVATVHGQTIAFLGCTTITGSEHPLSYVALDAQHKGGAAQCDENMIRNSIRDARAKHDIVVFMVHGGNEYQRTPSENVRKMTVAARESGAILVINHHPHVVGGFDWNGSSLVAWTMGNFLFDQTVWPTFESYLLAVHLRDGKVVQAYTEPLMIDGYLPKGITGDLADFVARGAAGRETGPFIVEDGAMEIDVNNRAIQRNTRLPVKGNSKVGTIFRVDKEEWVAGFSGPGHLRLGRDLLWVGGFEDEIVDEQHQGGILWGFTGLDKLLGSEYAYAGVMGARLERRGFNKSDVVLSPLHRILVNSGSELSIVGMVRSRTDTPASLQISWYSQTKGQSQAKQLKPLSIKSDNQWNPFRFDLKVPPHTVAIGLFLRLHPSARGKATADFDNIRIIKWEPEGTHFSPLYNYVRVTGNNELTIQKEFMPGGETRNSSTVPSKLVPLQE